MKWGMLCPRFPPSDSVAVALIDIDHFKSINDTMGHQGGDYVLEQYGHRLRQASGSSASCGRYGGEELIVFFTAVPSKEALVEHVKKIHAFLCEPIPFGASSVTVTCCIGLAIFLPGDTATRLIGRADRALYKGKRNGRNCVVLAD